MKDSEMQSDSVHAQDGKLWAVNVTGPDDLYAMASEAQALARANELNLYFDKLDEKRHAYDPIMRAVVIEWPHTPESHAAALAKEPGAQHDPR